MTFVAVNLGCKGVTVTVWASVFASCQVAISLKPSWAKGYYRAGLALAALNRAADAVDNLKRALALDPSNKTVVTKIAEVRSPRRPSPGTCGSLTAACCRYPAVLLARRRLWRRQLVSLNMLADQDHCTRGASVPRACWD